jgi:hypothetical protein
MFCIYVTGSCIALRHDFALTYAMKQLEALASIPFITNWPTNI